MPKGDRLKLKADPEDGTTPIANLLLEAVAMAKISGLQKGALCHLWRTTYGWVDTNGKRRKEAKISITDWMKALDRTKSRVSEALSGLEDMRIIFRRTDSTWGGYYYSLNTNISQWNSNSVNLTKLKKLVQGVPFPEIVALNGTIPENGNSCPKRNGTVAQNGTEQLPKTELPTLYKEILNKDIKKEGDNNLSPETGLNTKEVFTRLDNARGYRPTTKRKAEAAAIIRMLRHGFDPDAIVSTWESMKKDKFWQDKELFMMSVESQIGAMIHGKHQQSIKSQPGIRVLK